LRSKASGMIYCLLHFDLFGYVSWLFTSQRTSKIAAPFAPSAEISGGQVIYIETKKASRRCPFYTSSSLIFIYSAFNQNCPNRSLRLRSEDTTSFYLRNLILYHRLYWLSSIFLKIVKPK